MTEYAGRGDPRRSMELLWGVAPAPARGPKQGLTVDEIATAAMELADAEGLGALSMRRVAERLGRSAMSLYTYVPSKAELLDVMLHRALAELDVRHPVEDGWRVAVEASAWAGWAFYLRHPWVLHISGARALVGPNELAAYEAQLRLLDDLPLEPIEIVRTTGVVAGFVRGAALAHLDARTAAQATGQSDDEWWLARSALVEELAGPDWTERFPTITRLAAAQSFDQPQDDDPRAGMAYLERDALETFEFGLQVLLDGIEAAVDRRR